MEHQEQLEKETEEAINAINKKTGRNMPQAIATGAVLVILILACLLISIDLFVYLVVLFMVLALWELRVDFATAGLHIPVAVLWVCSAATLLSTYYSERHIVAMTVCVLVSLVVVAIAASAIRTYTRAKRWLRARGRSSSPLLARKTVSLCQPVRNRVLSLAILDGSSGYCLPVNRLLAS